MVLLLKSTIFTTAKGYRSVILERAIVLARNIGYRHHFASNRPELPG